MRCSRCSTSDVLPIIPSRGSVGASGDLAPLAHLSLCLIGEGEAMHGERRLEGTDVCAAAGFAPIALEAKEGLALINGTQLSLALALDGLFRARNTARRVDRDRRTDGRRARRAATRRSMRAFTRRAARRIRWKWRGASACCSPTARSAATTRTAIACRTRTPCAACRRCSARSRQRSLMHASARAPRSTA